MTRSTLSKSLGEQFFLNLPILWKPYEMVTALSVVSNWKFLRCSCDQLEFCFQKVQLISTCISGQFPRVIPKFPVQLDSGRSTTTQIWIGRGPFCLKDPISSLKALFQWFLNFPWSHLTTSTALRGMGLYGFLTVPGTSGRSSIFSTNDCILFLIHWIRSSVNMVEKSRTFVWGCEKASEVGFCPRSKNLINIIRLSGISKPVLLQSSFFSEQALANIAISPQTGKTRIALGCLAKQAVLSS